MSNKLKLLMVAAFVTSIIIVASVQNKDAETQPIAVAAQAKAIVNDPVKCDDRKVREKLTPSVVMAKRFYADAQELLAHGEFTPAEREALIGAMTHFKAEIDSHRDRNPCL